MLLALIARELGLRSYPIIYQKVLRGHITSTKVQLDTLPPYYVLLVKSIFVHSRNFFIHGCFQLYSMCMLAQNLHYKQQYYCKSRIIILNTQRAPPHGSPTSSSSMASSSPAPPGISIFMLSCKVVKYRVCTNFILLPY